MATANTQSAPRTESAALKAYEDKIRAQVQEAKATLDQFETKAKEKKAQAEITALNNLKASKQEAGRSARLRSQYES
jgi:hypothetical protein